MPFGKPSNSSAMAEMCWEHGVAGTKQHEHPPGGVLPCIASPGAWGSQWQQGRVFGISGSAMAGAGCCQGASTDLGLIRGHNIWEVLSANSFLKGVLQKKKKKVDNDLSSVLIAANYFCDSVAPVFKVNLE